MGNKLETTVSRLTLEIKKFKEEIKRELKK